MSEILCVHICPACKQEPHHVDPAEIRCEVQGCATLVILSIDSVPSVQEQCRGVAPSSGSCMVHWRHAGLVAFLHTLARSLIAEQPVQNAHCLPPMLQSSLSA